MMEDSNNNQDGGKALYNAAGLKVAQIRSIIEGVHFCHLHFREVNPETLKSYLSDWLSLLGSIKLEIYSKLNSKDKEQSNFMLNKLSEFLNNNPIYYPQLDTHRNPTGKNLTDYNNEGIFLKWINEFEKFLFVKLDECGMDNPNKETEGMFN